MHESLRMAATTDGVDFNALAALLEDAGLAAFDAKTRQRAFEGSSVVCFLYEGKRLIGCGRALSDGAYEAALYDVAVAADCQGRGLGKLIVETILGQLEGQNVIFFSSVGTEPFYEKLGCSRMLTGMAHWRSPERMRERGYSA